MKRIYDKHGNLVVPSLTADLGKIAVAFIIALGILQIVTIFI